MTGRAKEYSDPSREVLGLDPIWTGASDTPVEPEPVEPEEPEEPVARKAKSAKS